MADKDKKPKPSPSDDLTPRGNLPDKPTIPPGKGFGDDIKPKKLAKGGSVGSASKRADGIAQRGKTRGKIC